MNEYKMTFHLPEGTDETARITERTEAAARKQLTRRYAGAEITDVELVDEYATATKEQERETLEKIRRMVAELGPNSYLSTAFEGAFEDAEQNIEDDAAYNQKARADAATRRADAAEKQLKELAARADKLREENQSLAARLMRSVFPNDLYIDLWTLASDEGDASRKRMASAADRMAINADSPGCVAFQEAVKEYREQKARAERCEHMVAGLDEHRPEGV